MKSRKEKIRNLNIRYIMNVIIQVIEERRLRWFGHFKRIRIIIIPKMEWNAQGRGRKGKPRRQ
jgi:hypothetical protein